MSEPRIIRPGDPLYPAIERLNRGIEDALRPHRGKPGVEAAYALAEARRREVEAWYRAKLAREKGGDDGKPDAAA